MTFRECRSELLSAAALLAMLGWFCEGLIFESKIPVFRDLGPYFYPIKFSVAEAYKAFELPLWERHMAAGFPVMAGFQSAVFYPPNFFFAMFPFYTAIQFTFVVHYTIAAFGSYILFRWWKNPPYIALVGAAIFTFGGTTVSFSNLLNHFQSAVWLPWTILLWERTLTNKCSKEFIIFALVLLCQLLGGSPEIFLFSLAILLLDTFRLRAEGEIDGLKRPIVILIAACVVVIGLGMAQLLPTGELLAHSRRDQPILPSEAFSWSLRPSSLVGLLVPTVEADTSLSLGLRMLFSQEVPFLLSHYLGIVAFLGLCAWLGAATLKQRITVVFLIGGSLIFAFGRFTPIYPFLYEHLSLLKILRFPEKFFYLSFVLLIFATVRGLRHIHEAGEARWPAILVSVICSIWTAVYVCLRWNPTLLIHFLESPGQDNFLIPVTAPTLASIFFNLEKQIAISLIVGALFILYRLRYLRRALFQALLLITVFVDLSLAHKPLQFLRDKEFITQAERVLDKPPSEPSRIFYYPPGSNLHPAYVSVRGKPSFDKATEIPFNNLLPNAGMLFGFEYFQDIDALSRREYNGFLDYANALPREKRGKLLGALNVRYIISFRELEVPGLKLVREYPEHLSWLYEVLKVVPRAYIVENPIYELDPRRTLVTLTSDEMDLSRAVIVDKQVTLKSAGNSHGEAEITDYRNNRVRIHARLSASGVLVLTDAFYPGWKVYVDGSEKNILRANYFFRAVELSAGNHSVEFIYDPVSFKLGAAISALTATLLLAAPIILSIRRKRRFHTDAILLTD